MGLCHRRNTKCDGAFEGHSRANRNQALSALEGGINFQSLWGSVARMGPKQATETDQIVGHRIAAMRRAKGFSQADLGAAVGVTFQQIQKYESGINRVGAGRLQQIAKHLNVPVGKLYEDDSSSYNRSADLVLLGTSGAPVLLKAFSEIANDELRRDIVALVQSAARIGAKAAHSGAVQFDAPSL